MVLRTQQAYIDWIKRIILFHNTRHPAELGIKNGEAALAYPAVAS